MKKWRAGSPSHAVAKPGAARTPAVYARHCRAGRSDAKLGGLTTAQRLLNHLPGLPLISTRGYSRDHDVRTADLPMASYLQKPSSPTHLGRRVRDVLKGTKKQAVPE
jgi:hypothetical protein